MEVYEMTNPGYDDTPIIPGTNWRVHDNTRPQPWIVAPGTACSEEVLLSPPSDAVILFDGTDLSGWISTADGTPAGWKVENGYMEVVPGTGYIQTREEFGDCQLHLEFAAPTEIKGESQGRGNSGVFLMGLYEIQVLDCYENPTYADGTTGALYGQFPPLVNACRRPGEWQSYDVIWEGPRFDGDQVTRLARITVMLNGVLLHHATELRGPTAHKVVTEYEPHAETGPLALQDHSDLVRFRNIWYRPLKGYDQA
jgi:hypothetical protein